MKIKQLNKIHLDFKTRLLKEFLNETEVREYECYFRLRIDGSRIDSNLEHILIYIRGINGVTIVRTSDTTKRNSQGVYGTKVHIKYTPQTFNRNITLEDIYLFLEKEIRKFDPSISLTRISPPPGQLVTQN